MSETRWKELSSDKEFAALFAGATIVRATTNPGRDVPYLGADLFWLLSDGRWLAMEVSTSSGCPTCGYGGGEKTYYVYAPEVSHA